MLFRSLKDIVFTILLYNIFKSNDKNYILKVKESKSENNQNINLKATFF